MSNKATNEKQNLRRVVRRRNLLEEGLVKKQCLSLLNAIRRSRLNTAVNCRVYAAGAHIENRFRMKNSQRGPSYS